MWLLKQMDESEILFFDIETAARHKELPVDSPDYDAWEYYKNRDGHLTQEELLELYKKEAALDAEFSKVLCISMGMIVNGEMMVKSFEGDEEAILEEFNAALNNLLGQVKKLKLCGWAIKGFDVPFVYKRSLAHRIEPSFILEVAGKKPWDLDGTMVDLKEYWKGTSFKPSSMIAASVCLGVPHSKSDISGADVGRVYYSEGEKGLRRIVEYCERDVINLAQIWRALRFQEPVSIREKDLMIDEQPLIMKLASGGTFGARAKKDLEKFVADLKPKEVAPALDVLQALAESKDSKVTKAFVNQLKERYVEPSKK